MISKNLYYCNFGKMDLKDEIISRCIKSWEIYFPQDEWKWVEINESNFDINCCAYVKKCYESKKYAFVSDFARAYFLYNYGGIYVDTDLLMIKKISDDILNQDFFIGSSVNNETQSIYETISWGISGCEKKNYIIGRLLLKFYKTNHNSIVLMRETTNILKELGITKEKLLSLNDGEYYEFKDKQRIYSFDTFTCLNWRYDCCYITDNTYSIHLYSDSWLKSNKQIRKRKIKKFLNLKESINV